MEYEHQHAHITGNEPCERNQLADRPLPFKQSNEEVDKVFVDGGKSLNQLWN